MLSYITCQTFLASCYAAWSTFRITAHSEQNNNNNEIGLQHCKTSAVFLSSLQSYRHSYFALPCLPCITQFWNRVCPRCICQLTEQMGAQGVGEPINATKSYQFSRNAKNARNNLHHTRDSKYLLNHLSAQMSPFLQPKMFEKKLPPCEEIEKSLEEELCVLSQN